MSGPGFTILLTGSSGLLGRHVLTALCGPVRSGLIDAPLRVLAASRNPDALAGPELDASSVGRIRLALDEGLCLPDGIDTVIHVAGEKKDPARMMAVNRDGTRRLVRAAVRAGVRRFVNVSSVGVYGAAAHSGTVSEGAAHHPRNLYEDSKNQGESAVREICAAAGVEWINLQPSNVLALVPGKSYPLLGLMRMIRQRRFRWFGDGQPQVNYVDVDDVAAAIVAAALHAPSARDYIINTPAPLSAVVSWVCDELGVAEPQERLPLWTGRLIADGLSVAGKAQGRSFPFDRERLLELTNTTRYSPDSLVEAIGFEYPRNVESMIRAFARHYVQEKLL